MRRETNFSELCQTVSQLLLLGPGFIVRRGKQMMRKQAKVEKQGEAREGDRNQKDSRKKAKVGKVGKIEMGEKGGGGG